MFRSFDKAADIAAAVNMVTEDKSAETFAAPAEVPSGSAYEPADPTVANPLPKDIPNLTLLLWTSSQRWNTLLKSAVIPVSQLFLIPTVKTPLAKVSVFPVWYGSAEEDSKEYNFTFTVYDVDTGKKTDDGEVSVTAANETEARGEAMRMLEEGGLDDEEFVLDAEGGRLRDIRGKFMNRRKAKDAVFGEVMSQQMSGYYRTGIVGDNPPVGQNIARRNPAAKARYFIEPGVQNPNSGEWSKGPNFQQARKIAKGVAWDTVQDMGLAAETASFAAMPSFTAFQKNMKRKQMILKEQMLLEPSCIKEESCPVWFVVPNLRMVYGSREDPFFVCERRECLRETERSGSPLQINSAETAGLQMTTLGDQEFPVVPDSYGESSAVVSGRGVPQWYGSAEQGYNDKMDESLGMRHRGSHKQSMKDRRDEASAMDKMHTRMGRKYDDVSTMDAQSITETLEEAAPVSLKKPFWWLLSQHSPVS